MKRKDERVGAIFSALSDATRRELIARLGEGSKTPTELAEDLPISRQAVSKHLQALGEAGLVASEREGRETRYRLTPAPMADAVSWMASTGAEWDARLARLKGRLGR